MNAKDIALIKAIGGGGSGGSITVDSALSDTSTNPVQNRVIKSELDALERFVVTFTASEDGNIASDKTFDEIFDAYKAGKKVSGVVLIARDYWTELYVSAVNGDEIDFFAMTSAPDGCQYVVVHVSRTGGSSFITGLLTQAK